MLVKAFINYSFIVDSEGILSGMPSFKMSRIFKLKEVIKLTRKYPSGTKNLLCFINKKCGKKHRNFLNNAEPISILSAGIENKENSRH
ncbi:MAG: hypothetical protein IH594_05405 [Bacteroidales bacterium]|nr:hypothetical protein [Bacteroidales bacterium]